MNPRYLLLMLCVGLLIVGTASAWYDVNWDYRKSITINNTGSNLTDYQVAFTVNRSAGTDSGSTVYLNGKCESDYDDIRFVGADDTTAWDYWIESSSSTVATIWVEVPSIVNSTAYGSTTGYLYYGNSGASAVSNGDAAFPFFDDFDTYDTTTKWTTASGIPVASGGKLVFDGSDECYSKTATFGVNYAIRYKSDIANTNYCVVGFSGGGDFVRVIYGYPTGSVHQGSNQAGVSPSSISLGALGTSTRVIDIKRNSITNSIFNVDGGANTILATNLPTGAYPLSLTYAQSVWWILVRKYTATEPTISDWGEEEIAPIAKLYTSFSALPTSGYVPLLVSFSDLSTAENATINTWMWSFGDSSANSTQQNPQHQYTTSGLYDVILTITNTSYSLTNSTKKSGYINAKVNADAPNADFTTTETCGDVGNAFYFIDFSTGGGLYAWNWSFGDGVYSELRNPTHQYVGEGTYDVSLTVWGAYGNDTLTRSNLIAVPCGTVTPTPTATPTGTGTITPGGTSSPLITYDSGTTWITWSWNATMFNASSIYVDNWPVTGYPLGTLTISELHPGERHILKIVNSTGAYYREAITKDLIWETFSADLWFWYILLLLLTVIGLLVFAFFIPAWIIGLYCVLLAIGQNEWLITLMVIGTWLVTMILMIVRWNNQ